MAAPNAAIKVYVEMVVDEVTTVLNTLKEKGAKRFGRTLALTGGMLVATYAGLYMPPQQKSARLQSQIDKARVLAGLADQFVDLRGQLNQAYSGLPSVTDRDQWLSNSVRDSLLVGGLAPKAFTQIHEDEESGLIFQTSAVSLDVKFSEFYDWLLRIESAKPLMHMQLVALTKDAGRQGYNTANCEVATVIPSKRFK
jgi:type II secretory pathway component PulM